MGAVAALSRATQAADPAVALDAATKQYTDAAVAAITPAMIGAQATAEKNAANGYLGLDGGGNVPTAKQYAATTSSYGIVQLAGDLAGTAAAPTVPGKRDRAPTVTSAGNIGAGGTLTPAVAAATTGDVWRATATGSTINLAVPTGTPDDGISIRVEILASVATTITVNASILPAGGASPSIAVPAGKRWFGVLTYVSGVGWFLPGSAPQA